MNTKVNLQEIEEDNPLIEKMIKKLGDELHNDQIKILSKLKNRKVVETDINNLSNSDKLWNQMYFILLENEIIGCVGLSESSYYKNIIWLTNIYLIKSFRNKGIGKVAIEKCIEKIKDKKYVYLCVNYFGQKRESFYERIGFKQDWSKTRVMDLSNINYQKLKMFQTI